MSNVPYYSMSQENVTISPQQYADLRSYHQLGIHRLARMAPVVYTGDYPADPQLRANSRPIVVQAPVVIPGYGGQGRLHHWMHMNQPANNDYHYLAGAYGYMSRY